MIVGGRGHYEVGGRMPPAVRRHGAVRPRRGADHYLEERTPDFEMWILALKPALLERDLRGPARARPSCETVAAGDCARLLSVDDARWLGR